MAAEAGAILAYVGLGSNLAGPADQVRRACAALARLPATRLLKTSRLYTSPPLGPVDQPDYVNAVAALATELEPRALLAHLQAIEAAHGRSRQGPRWGPRTLDLDLLIHGREIWDEPGLRLPHPEIPRRAFVLVPLAEVAPLEIEIPGMGTLEALLAACPPEGLALLTATAGCEGEAGLAESSLA